MKRIFRDFLSRVATAGLFIILGVCVCSRALSYSNPLDPTMIAPLLCVFLGILLAMTGVTLALRGGDLPPDLPDHDHSPSQSSS
ncbi:MAG TPA: hypothetical protein VGQ99_16880 [Tepidisphaeraceae bacterium]|jgi:hypothetical protein|nr:hypothetical protein [Tepidisphaeraceae bacterium]